MGVSLFVVCIFWKIFSENRIKDELFGGGGTIKHPSSLARAIVHTHTGTRTHPDRILSGAALVLMELIRRRMVIQTRRLWAVRVESRRDSDSGVQQLHVLPHGHHARNGVMVLVFWRGPRWKILQRKNSSIYLFFFGGCEVEDGEEEACWNCLYSLSPSFLGLHFLTFSLSSPFLSPSRAFLIWCWALCLNMKFFIISLVSEMFRNKWNLLWF